MMYRNYMEIVEALIRDSIRMIFEKLPHHWIPSLPLCIVSGARLYEAL